MFLKKSPRGFDWRGVGKFAGVGAYDLRSDASDLTPIDEQMEIRQ